MTLTVEAVSAKAGATLAIEGADSVVALGVPAANRRVRATTTNSSPLSLPYNVNITRFLTHGDTV